MQNVYLENSATITATQSKKMIPTDISTVLRSLDLAPVTVAYVCCPRCFALYKLSATEDDNYPEQCPERRSDSDEPCNARLRVERTIGGRKRAFPVRRFLLQDFHHWLARLLNRPGLEEHMDNPEHRLQRDPSQPASDIWDAEVLHQIELPDGSKFLNMDTDEGRYVFGICIDGLNPRGKGGPSHSVGSIFLVCYNLPPYLRYKPENMYLAGVIPGPHHPSKEQINHFLRPVVGYFQESMERGTYFTCTPNYPTGKTARSALGPAVADSLAAHQMSGHAPPKHTQLCPYCHITGHDLENLDHKAWPRRTPEEQRSTAELWLDASANDRETIYTRTGVRWSELLSLSYWNSASFLGIDIMHNLYLGCLKHHVEAIWGMDAELHDGLDGITYDPAKRKPSAMDMVYARSVLLHGSDKDLDDLLKPLLRQLCRERELRFSGRVGKLRKALKKLVRTFEYSPPMFELTWIF